MLKAQVAEAAKNAETAEQLRGEIAELKAQGVFDRVDFMLQLADAHSVRTARAILADHSNDIDKLKEIKPWLFSDAPPISRAARPAFPTPEPARTLVRP